MSNLFMGQVFALSLMSGLTGLFSMNLPEVPGSGRKSLGAGIWLRVEGVQVQQAYYLKTDNLSNLQAWLIDNLNSRHAQDIVNIMSCCHMFPQESYTFSVNPLRPDP